MVVAVNGYDETSERVQAYMKANGLTYPVLLQGSKVAAERYFLSAYPTQFWIDHQGVIVARHVGFEEEDVGRHEARLVELLAARNRRDR